MKTLVVGAGAMGSLFGGKLKQANFDVTLFNRSNDHMKKINKDGLRIIERDTSISKVDIPIVVEPANLAKRYDLIIILLKTFATDEVIQHLVPVVDQETIVLSLQNGVGNLEKLLTWFPDSYVGAGGTGCGAGVIENGLIAHRAWGKTYIGFSNKELDRTKLNRVAVMLTQSGIETDVSDDVQSVIWTKLIVNVAYNALTAITRLKNGDVVLPTEGKELVRKLVEEALMVADAKGIQLLYKDPIKECIEIGLTKIGENKSSMLTDILNERKTEIEVINGAVVHYGKIHSIPTPYNDLITNLIKLIEGSYSRKIEHLN